ncbi:MAG: hypothetical protein BGO69_00540 [Bacteroidetes bacterium 46-16]|nr:MAG: hypothetical protein BGO69_00540 [Bacteroidetes bacterium 46-16]
MKAFTHGIWAFGVIPIINYILNKQHTMRKRHIMPTGAFLTLVIKLSQCKILWATEEFLRMVSQPPITA